MNIHSPLEEGLGDWIKDSVVTSFEDADIVLAPGGSDLNPVVYGHSKLSTTFVNSKSDSEELNLLDRAIFYNKFIIGICKSAQTLTALAGGWLIQDVDHHHSHHEIETSDGKTFTVNSSHHQMCYPYDLPDEDYQLLGWAKGISSKYIIQNNKNYWEDLYGQVDGGYFKEPEVVYYPGIKGLAVQFHPEYTSAPKEANEWLNQLVIKLLKKCG